MKEKLSTKVTFDDAISLKEILSLHHFSKGYNGKIYIRSYHKLVSFNNLPKLVSFLLTLKSHELEIVIEGTDPEQTLIKIQGFLKTDNNYKTNLLSPSY